MVVRCESNPRSDEKRGRQRNEDRLREPPSRDEVSKRSDRDEDHAFDFCKCNRRERDGGENREIKCQRRDRDDFEQQHRRAGRLSMDANADADGARLGVGDGIGDEVDQNLPQTYGVRMDERRDRGGVFHDHW